MDIFNQLSDQQPDDEQALNALYSALCMYLCLLVALPTLCK